MRAMLFTGGSRSGKSALAQRWTERQGPRRVYLATATVEDAEMAERVRLHQAVRGEGWSTVEEQLDMVGAIRKVASSCDAVMLDCITLWLSNCMSIGEDDATILARVRALAALAADCPVRLGIVTNEIGWGIVPESALARRFRDIAGETNQILAAVSYGVVLAVCGLPVAVKGGVPHALR